jgi:hypothetical protein
MFDTVTATPDNSDIQRITLESSLAGMLIRTTRARYAGKTSAAKIAVHMRVWTTGHGVWTPR